MVAGDVRIDAPVAVAGRAPLAVLPRVRRGPARGVGSPSRSSGDSPPGYSPPGDSPPGDSPLVHFGASRAWDVRSGETLRDVATAVAKELSDVIVSGAAVDDHMLDQLVVFLALGGGGEVLARNPISLHARTAMAVCEQAMPWVRFETTETNDGRLVLVTCDVGTEPRDW